MKRFLMSTAALVGAATMAQAGGIERTTQSLSPLFEPGNYAEVSVGRVSPSIDGRDVALFGGRKTGDVADTFTNFGFAYKRDLTDALSLAMIYETPFGADVSYPLGKSYALGGTFADVSSQTLTTVLRYKMQGGFGVHGGVRIDRADGEVGLRGLAYGPVSGYNVKLKQDTATGLLAGVSWEKPEIAARVALTYNDAIEHDFDTVETGPLVDPDGPGPYPALPLLAGNSTTKVKTPRSWNLDFQTGVAADTLVFGQIRWVKWSEFRVDPKRFGTVTGGGLVDLEDTTTLTLGVGRKFSDQWSGSASVNYERKGAELVSPLAPTRGRMGMTLAAIYTMDNMKITTGINYTKLGDASPETGTPDTARAKFDDNHALGVGMKVGFTF